MAAASEAVPIHGRQGKGREGEGSSEKNRQSWNTNTTRGSLVQASSRENSCGQFRQPELVDWMTRLVLACRSTAEPMVAITSAAVWKQIEEDRHGITFHNSHSDRAQTNRHSGSRVYLYFEVRKRPIGVPYEWPFLPFKLIARWHPKHNLNLVSKLLYILARIHSSTTPHHTKTTSTYVPNRARNGRPSHHRKVNS